MFKSPSTNLRDVPIIQFFWWVDERIIAGLFAYPTNLKSKSHGKPSNLMHWGSHPSSALWDLLQKEHRWLKSGWKNINSYSWQYACITYSLCSCWPVQMKDFVDNNNNNNHSVFRTYTLVGRFIFLIIHIFLDLLSAKHYSRLSIIFQHA